MKIAKWLFIALLAILSISCITPYVIPLSRPVEMASLPYPESAFFTVDRVMVHYRFFKPIEGRVKGNVLLVHGLGGSTWSFSKTVGPLTESGWNVIAVDLPGFGYSMRSEQLDHSQEARSRLLWRFLDAVAPDMQWHLVGHSMGGGTVAAMAVERPQQTASLVLVDGALVQSGPAGGFPTWFGPAVRWVQVLVEHSFTSVKRITALLEGAYGRPPTEEEVRIYRSGLTVPGTARGLKALLKTSCNIPLERFSDLTMPVLALWGEQDTWVPPSQIDVLKPYFKDMKVVLIPDAGHLPLETHPQQTNEALLGFLASIR